jgi:hypothetical protein
MFKEPSSCTPFSEKSARLSDAGGGSVIDIYTSFFVDLTSVPVADVYEKPFVSLETAAVL